MHGWPAPLRPNSSIGAVKPARMNPWLGIAATLHAAVRVPFGSLMVQRDQWDTSWGAKKINFLIRDIDGPAMTAASMESCRFAVRRSPGGRFWSVVDVGNRLQRMRGGFHRCIHISKVLCALLLCTMIPPSFGSRALWGAPSTGACGVGDYLTTDLSQRESASRSASEKSKSFGPDGAPFPSKTSITRGPPVVAVAVSLDPILPQR